MITFGDKRFVAVSPDNTAQVFSPVKGRGGAHALTLATPERPGVDVLRLGDKITAVCGSKLTAANLTPGATRAMCVKCDAWLKSDAHKNEVSRTLAAWRSANATDTTPDTRVTPDTSQDSDTTPTGEDSAPVKIKAKGREIDPVARETDGTCAYEIREDDGTLTLKIVHGRSGIEPVPGSESANASGEDTGTCPVCRTHVKLTGKGFIPTHRPGNVTPDGPVLAQKSVPVVDRGTAVADMAKVREREAYQTVDADGNELSAKEAKKAERDGETVTVVPVVPQAPDAGAAVGNRDHGRLDGVAMTAGDLPPVQPQGKGYAAKAGTMALPVGRPRPDAQVINDVTVGGRCGYLTAEEYDGLSRTGQRKYWRDVATNRERAARARRNNRNKAVATGERISPERRKAARKSARVGSSASGTIARPVTRVGK